MMLGQVGHGFFFFFFFFCFFKNNFMLSASVLAVKQLVKPLNV